MALKETNVFHDQVPEVLCGARATHLAAIDARVRQLQHRELNAPVHERPAIAAEMAKNMRWREQWSGLDVARAEASLHVGPRHRE